jgi:hypothetical protein
MRMKKPDFFLRRKIKNFILAAGLVTFSAVIGFNCSGFKTSDSMNGSDSAASLNGTDKGIPVGFLSSEQLLKSMISVSGIETLGDLATPDDASIDSTYQARTGSLPSVQDMSAATGPTLIAVTNLASSVCNKAVDNDVAALPADRLFFSNVNFGVGLGQSSDVFVSGFTKLARNAWRRDVTEDESGLIASYAAEFKANSANINDPVQSKLLATSICTAVLSSTDALTY